MSEGWNKFFLGYCALNEFEFIKHEGSLKELLIFTYELACIHGVNMTVDFSKRPKIIRGSRLVHLAEAFVTEALAVEYVKDSLLLYRA